MLGAHTSTFSAFGCCREGSGVRGYVAAGMQRSAACASGLHRVHCRRQSRHCLGAFGQTLGPATRGVSMEKAYAAKTMDDQPLFHAQMLGLDKGDYER